MRASRLRPAIAAAAFAALAGVAASVASSGGGPPGWPSRTLLAYKCGDSLCLTEPGSRARRRLLVASRPWPQWDPAFSPDGREIAFRGYYAPPADGAYALYAAPIGGCAAKRLTRGIAGDPAWSPDGRWIAFDTSGYGEIDKVRPDGTGLTRLFAGHGADEGWSPAWSPDGRWIAFVRERRHGSQIWLMRPDGTGKHLLHADPTGTDQSLAWSHDGRRLAFVRSPAIDRGAIAVMRADGSHLRTLTGGDPAWNPVWLRGDAGIAYLTAARLADGGLPPGRLYAMRADGSGTHAVAGPRTIQFASTRGLVTARSCA